MQSDSESWSTNKLLRLDILGKIRIYWYSANTPDPKSFKIGWCSFADREVVGPGKGTDALYTVRVSSLIRHVLFRIESTNMEFGSHMPLSYQLLSRNFWASDGGLVCQDFNQCCYMTELPGKTVIELRRKQYWMKNSKMRLNEKNEKR